MEQVPGKFLAGLADVDLVVVPSAWNRQALVAAGLRVKVAVVPYTPDETPPAERAWPLWGTPDDAYVFHTINAWEPRKNLEALVRRYLETVAAADRVWLVVKTTWQDRTRFRPGPLWEHLGSRTHESVPWLVHSLRREYPGAASVRLLPMELSRAQLAALHRRGDCCVSLTHSEGWGLGAFDAAAAGRPVIMTGFGAQREFLPAHLGWLLDYDLSELPSDEYMPHSAQWADPDLAQARRLMRHTAAHPAEGRERGRALAALVNERYTPAQTTRQLLRALD